MFKPLPIIKPKIKPIVKKQSPLLQKKKPDHEDFDFEIPKFLDLRISQQITRDPFDNGLKDRNLDDLWFTIGHYYHEFSPEKSDKSTSFLKKSHSNMKKTNKEKSAHCEENDDIFDILSYITKNKKKEEMMVSAKKERKTNERSKSIKKQENIIKIEKKEVLKRKPQANLFKIHIPLKKIIKNTELIKPNRFMKLTLKKPQSTKEIKTHKENIKNKANQNDNKENKGINSSNLNHNKTTSTIFDNRKIHNKFNKNPYNNRNSKSNNSKSFCLSFANDASTLSVNNNLTTTVHNNNNVSYVPAYHGTRDIRKWEKISGKLWYNLNTKERLLAIDEINKMIAENKKNI